MQRRMGAVILGALALMTLGAEPKPKTLTVMSWNLYFGADTAPILAARTMDELAKRADAAWKTLESTRFKERAQAIADQIASEQPQLIGLQEVALLRVQSPGDRRRGGLTPAETVVLDFESILLAELTARGLAYRVVNRVENADVEVPRANPTLDDVRLTDHDVILARADVQAFPSILGNYQSLVSLPLPDGKSSINVSRGYVMADVRWMGQDLNFVNTHLETTAFEAIQRRQAAELVEILGNPSLPNILVGDFNSRPEAGPQSSYQLITRAGFRDVWNARLDKEASGLTCCQSENLANKTSNLEERIDLILTKNTGAWLQNDVDMRVLGAGPEDLTASGLWPSDHAGVVARFTLK